MSMKTIAAVLFLCVVVVACNLMSPQQQSEALAAVDEMLRNGSITRAQYDAMREAILAASSSQWWSQAATAVLGGVLGHVTTQIRRGPVATPPERDARRKARGK